MDPSLKANELILESYRRLKAGDYDFQEFYFSESFNKSSNELIAIVQDIFEGHYIDLHGERPFGVLIDSIDISESNETACAIAEHGKFRIEFGRSFLRVLHFLNLISRGANSVLRMLNRQSDDFDNRELLGTDPFFSMFLSTYGIPVTTEMNEIVSVMRSGSDGLALSSAPNDPDYKIAQKFADNYLFALIWIVSHELGHVVCGHLGPGNVAAKRALTETFARSEPADPKEIGTEIDRNVRHWATEYMADSYATIRSNMLADQIWSARGSKPRLEDMSSLSFASFLPIYAISALAQKSAGTTMHFSQDIFEMSSQAYPSAFSRMLNCFAATYFCLDPLENPHRPSPNLWVGLSFRQQSYIEKLAPNERTRQIFYLLHDELGKMQILMLETGMLSKPLDAGMLDDMEIWIAAILLMRIGLSTFEFATQSSSLRNHETMQTILHFNESSRFQVWGNHLRQWHISTRILVEDLNIAFAAGFPDAVTGSIPKEKYETFLNSVVKPIIGNAGLESEVLYDTELDRSDQEKDLFFRYAEMNRENSRHHLDAAYQILDNWMAQMYENYTRNRWSSEEEVADAIYSGVVCGASYGDYIRNMK